MLFGAREKERKSMRMSTPEGKIGHSQIWIGKAFLMIADLISSGIKLRSPQTIGGSPVTMVLHVNDVDEVANRAVTPGATDRPEQRRG